MAENSINCFYPSCGSKARTTLAPPLPVIISNHYMLYASPMKSTLHMPDYSIFMDEQDFLARPIHELSKLQLLSEAFIREKLTSLNYAQRCLFADHPKSIFVPTLLKETLAAISAANARKRVNSLHTENISALKEAHSLQLESMLRKR